MIITALTVIFLLYLVNYFWFISKNSDQIKLAKKLKPGFLSCPIIGHSYMVFGNPQSIMTMYRTIGYVSLQNGGATSAWFANELFVILSDPEMTEVIMKKCLEKHAVGNKLLQLLIGNGSAVAPAKIWRHRRKVLAPTFSSRKMVNNLSVFNAKNEVMTKKLQTVAGTGNFSIWSYISAYSMDSLCESTMGVTVDAQTGTKREKVLKALCELIESGGVAINKPWINNPIAYKLLPYVPFFAERKSVLEEFIDEIIRSKREMMEENKTSTVQTDETENCLKSFLELFVESTTLTNDELLEETKVMLIAGTDTTSVAIAFTIAMLARHPDVQDKVYQELFDVFGDSPRAVNTEDLARLQYLEIVIKETVRMFPPIPNITRKITQDIQIRSDLTVPKGCGVMISVWAIHRNPKYWGSDAEIFRPERFINDMPKHPAAFMPFGYGPRACLGYKYAMYSLKCTLVSILRQYRILPPSEPQNGHKDNTITNPTKHSPMRLTFEIVVKDKDKFVVQLENRNKQ